MRFKEVIKISDSFLPLAAKNEQLRAAAAKDICFICSLSTQLVWKQSGKPYFNLHRTIEKALQNSSFEIDPGEIPRSVIHQLRSIEIRVTEKSGIEPFFLSVGEVSAIAESGNIVPTNHSAVTCVFHHNGSWFSRQFPFGDAYIWSDENTEWIGGELTDYESELSDRVYRVAFGVLLLAADPDYITPDLLNRDKNRDFATPEDYERAIARAHRRGKIGYEIGKEFEEQCRRESEASPHFRRPHFGIRWMGKGENKTPRLRPIKGAVVNRKKLLEIPTGYADDEHQRND